MAQNLLRTARESLPNIRLIDGDGKSAA